MQRQSVEALDQLTRSDEIVASIETHGTEVAARLDERWPVLSVPTEPTLQATATSPPDFLGQLFTIRDGLVVSATSLSKSDQRHVHQLAKLIRVREEREELKNDVAGTFTVTRRTIEELHGPNKAFVLAGFESPTARTTKKLLRQTDLALPRLRDADLEEAEPKVAGVKVDSNAMADALEKKVARLRPKQAEFERLRREVQASRKEKSRRLEEHRHNVTWSARIVEGYYQLAGEKELADRLRPIVRRAGRPTQPTPTEPPPDADSGAEEPAVDSGPSVEPAPAGSAPEERASQEESGPDRD